MIQANVFLSTPQVRNWSKLATLYKSTLHNCFLAVFIAGVVTTSLQER